MSRILATGAQLDNDAPATLLLTADTVCFNSLFLFSICINSHNIRVIRVSLDNFAD